MESSHDRYPVECPFCKIAAVYPASSESRRTALRPAQECVPDNPDATKLEPNCHLVLSSPAVMAFLDIMPMAPGHLLVATRRHRVKIGDVPSDEASDIGKLTLGYLYLVSDVET
jgi:diadenosine tetraphosphate (Ap4A) HIT family hydrolase